jgi:uncharacterized protein YjdB
MVSAQPLTGFVTNPSGTNYTADANYGGTGSVFEQGKIVYKGTGQSVTITNLQSGVLYYFRAFTRKGSSWTGGVETSIIPSSSSGGTLTGSGSASTTTVSLSTEGTADWAHWPGYDHKSTGGSKIGNYTTIGSAPVYIYLDDQRTCSWSVGGTPTVSGSNTRGVNTGGSGNGFQLTAPADQTLRTLKLYIGGYKSVGTLTAKLSDGSAADYVNVITPVLNAKGQYDAVYTLTYKAASAGKLLTVKWVQSSTAAGGNVTLQAATLVEAAVPAPVSVTGVTITPSSASIATNTTQQLTAAIAPSNAGNRNVSYSSSNTAVATVSTTGLVAGVAAGTATITVTTQDGNFKATSVITVTQAQPGSLSGSGSASTTTVNLSTEGTADWAHWPGYDHKATGGSKISNYTAIGASTVYMHLDDQRTCVWASGTPVASGSNTRGVNIAGTGNGFQLTAPADQTLRTLKLYIGGYKSVGTFTAKLSDGSAADYVNVITPVLNAKGQYDAVYTLTYKAASAGKLLTVKWVQSSTAAGGNVTLQAATLSESSLRLIPNNNNLITNKTDSSTDAGLSDQLFTVYPNPFKNDILLNYSGKETGKGTIMLFNAEMKAIAVYGFEKITGNFMININTSGLTSGLYFVQLNIGNNKRIKRVVKIQ